MILGDGNLGIYRKKNSKEPRCHYLRIYCHLEEKQYAKEIASVMDEVFCKKSYWYERPSENVLYIEISAKDLDILLGLPIGDKIKNKVTIPDWIYDKESYLVACLRGLFDTDGCCYITGGKYKIVNFANRNEDLLENIFVSLKALNFHPFRIKERNVEIGRKNEVTRFFEIVKPKNVKHYRHFAEVAKVVKARV